MAQENDSRILRRWFAVGVVVVVVFAIWLILRPFAMAIAWAAILAFLMFPLQLQLTRRFKGRGALAAAHPHGPHADRHLHATVTAGAGLHQAGRARWAAALQHNPDLFDMTPLAGSGAAPARGELRPPGSARASMCR